MSGSHSSREDHSSGGSSTDDRSGDESGSQSASSSNSASGDESSSDSENDSSSGNGSGSSSGEDDDDNGSSGSGSGSEGSGDSEEEGEEEEGDTEEKRLARKREDFEKMKEISAHMDNIVHRLAAFFPREDANAHGPTAATELPALPIPPPDKAVHRSVSARVMTMDRAVSARQLTTDRAISVASGMHFDDELSDSSAVSNTRYKGQHNTGSRRAARNGQDAAGRRPSAADANGAGGDRTGPERHVGARDQHQTDDAFASQGRRESWDERNAGIGSAPRRELSGGRRRSRVSPGSPAADVDAEGLHERLLWDDLRESLEGAAASEKIPATAGWARGVAVEKTKEDRDREQRRRRLIDEAIAVLLEGSSSSGSSSDGERSEDDAM